MIWWRWRMIRCKRKRQNDCVHSFIHSFTHSLQCKVLLIHSFIHLLLCKFSFIHSFIPLFIHSFNHPFVFCQLYLLNKVVADPDPESQHHWAWSRITAWREHKSITEHIHSSHFSFIFVTVSGKHVIPHSHWYRHSQR